MKNSIKHILLYIENRKQRYQHDLETEVSYSVITEIRERLSELNQLQRVVEGEFNRLNSCKFDLIDRTVLKEELESLKVNFTGLQNGTMGAEDALEEQKRSILAVLDEQMTCEVSEKESDWIPVETELPLQRDSMFAKFKGTDKWSNAMFEKISDEVCITIQYDDGTKRSTTSHLIDGQWEIERKPGLHRKVIAWKPMPEVY